MARPLRQAPTQVCPNCQTVHDVGVYVSGQKLLCKCGIRFEVRRTDVSSVGIPSAGAPSVVAATGTGAGASAVGAAGAPASPGSPALAQTVTWKRGESRVAAGEAHEDSRSEGGTESPSPAAGVSEDHEPESGAQSAPREAEEDRTFIANTTKIQLPGYELLEILGRGGMGEVWKARQLSLGRTVAVKILPARLAKDQEFVTRFEKEATALASLSHPNIIQIIDRGLAGDHYFFAMELVTGCSLRERIGSGRMEPPDALRLVVQLCRAVDYAHEQNIVHRDLKPENVLIDNRGHIKVADFGLAVIRHSEQRLQLTATAVAMGTINYMAPEQRRDAKSVDGRADIYSIGVMLYELLTGELPLGRFKLPSEKVPGLDARVDAIVAAALEPEPGSRTPRASLVAAALEEVLGHSEANRPVSGLASAAPGGSAAASTGRSSRALAAGASAIERSWRGLKVGLMVVGALATVAFIARLFPAEKSGGKGAPLGGQSAQAKTGSGGTGSSNSDLFASAAVQEKEGAASLQLDFVPGKEKLHAHAGEWTLEGGALRAIQAGSETGDPTHPRLVPRAYVAHRYFSTDDFVASVDVRSEALGNDYPLEEDAQQYAELSLRIKDLQVSVFAIPQSGMRLMWRYFTQDGVEVIGNSARDLEDLVEDEMPVPPGTFRVKLALRRIKGGVDVEAFANGQRFAHKTLLGLQGQTGKVALGCRNLRCTFDNLEVRGKRMEQPQQRAGQER